MHPYIKIFGNNFPLYGGLIAIGAVFAVLLAVLVTRRKYDFEFVDYVFFLIWPFVLGILGAKLLYLIVELDSFIKNPELFWVYLRGGGVFYGGLIGGIVGLFISARKRKWNFFASMDTLCSPLALAHAFGRVGCFMGGCCYGAPTDSIFGVIYPEGSAAPSGIKLLPTQLFEAAFLLVLCLVMLAVLKKTKKVGLTCSVYLIAYGIWRFFIEFFRFDERGSVGLLSTSQFISIFILTAGMALMILALKGKLIKEKHLPEES